MDRQRQERRAMHRLNTGMMYAIFGAMRHTSHVLREQEFARETQLTGVLSVHTLLSCLPLLKT